jgi:type VI secretion system protein ImpG
MDRRLLSHYNNELAHLRQMGAEFAQEFPKIAGRLALDSEAKEICPDPFVERLLEGFAFLTARVQLKLDAEFPRFTQAILETVYPYYLCPTPSMAIARFEPDEQAAQMAEGFLIPRRSVLKSILGNDEHTPCEFRTAHDVRLWPLRITEAEYLTRGIGSLELPGNVSGRAAFRIRLQSPAEMPLHSITLDTLPFFLRGTDEIPVRIYEQIFSRSTSVVIRGLTDERNKPTVVLPRTNIRRLGFGDDEALLPNSPRSFSGYRLLHEYFACPQRFLFFEINDLRAAISRFACNRMDIIILLDEPEVRLENRVDSSNFNLFCTPAINLFPKRADRISLSDRASEFQVVMDKTRPVDFEVYQIESITGHGSDTQNEREFCSFYQARETDLEASAFYTVNRIPRMLSEKERKFGAASSYAGDEVYLSLVDSADAPYRDDLNQLGVKALCTNRHLPVQMSIGVGRTDFTLEMQAPVASVKCLTVPTRPHPPFAEGERCWRIINHLSLNYLSLLDQPGGEGAVALRELLKLYADPGDAHLRKQIDGLRSAQAKPIVRRVEQPGLIAFARGLEVTVVFDENAFEGTGIFLLGAVLEQFFARYVSLNSFTETVIRTEQRGEIIRWTQRLGSRHLT